MIDFPDKGIQYYYSNIERHNEVRREALQSKFYFNRLAFRS